MVHLGLRGFIESRTFNAKTQTVPGKLEWLVTPFLSNYQGPDDGTQKFRKVNSLSDEFRVMENERQRVLQVGFLEINA